MKVYAMSDIHGSAQALANAVTHIFKTFDVTKDKLLFLGDYIDRGPDSFKVLKIIHNLQKDFGKETIIVLRGNHDQMFFDWLDYRYNTLHLANDPTLTTVKSFMKNIWPGRELFFDGINSIFYKDGEKYIDATEEIIQLIKENNKELLDWYRKTHYYELIRDTLFVHAGFTENPGWNWAESSEQEMIWKYPATYGYTPWNKKVVAGHIMTRELHPEYVPQEKEDSIYRNKDHIYIDGAACVTGKVNILVYDTKNKLYYDGWTHEIISE